MSTRQETKTSNKQEVASAIAADFPRIQGIENKDTTVSFLGVEVNKGSSGTQVPKSERLKDYVTTNCEMNY